MIKNLKIKGYKSIRNLNLELSSINILIGENGVGKSNFINFFDLIWNIYNQRLQSYSLKKGVEKIFHYGTKFTSEVSGSLNLGKNIYKFVLESSDEGSLYISQEDSIYNDDSIYYCNNKESKIKTSDSFRNKYLQEHLEGYRIYHFHDTSVTSSLRSSSQINDNRILRQDGANLPSYLYFLKQKHPKTFYKIEKVVQSIIPFFEKFDLEPDSLEENRIKLVWKERDHPHCYFDATNLSDGSLRFIALATLFLQPELPKTIIVDEPELGLHPRAINKLAGLIKSAAAKKCQIIISTQSINLMNNFSAEDIITVNKRENQSIFNRVNSEELEIWLNNYSLGDLWVKNIINA